MVENWMSFPVFIGIGIPHPAEAGPAHRIKVVFSYQLIWSVELALELKEIMIPGVIGFSNGVLLDAISCSGLALQAMVEGITLLTADPIVARYPCPVRLV